MERVDVEEVAAGCQLGDYQLGPVIAQGSLGTIHGGIHSLSRKRVAVKVLKRRVVHDTLALTAFIREVYAVNEIGHPGVVDVYGIGALADGRFFVVMDLLEGTSLRQIQQQKQRLQPGVALPIFEQLCRIVETVHDAGYLHLGLRPERVLVLRCPPYPTIRVLGFGSDRLVARSADFREPTLMSAPVYTAPEQQPGGTSDGRADVYAIGALLYELLVGRQLSLYPAEATRAQSLATVGGALRKVVLRALAWEPGERYGSPSELLLALRGALGDPLPWNVDLERSSGGTHVTGPPEAARVTPLAPEAVEGEIPADEISARAAVAFRVEGYVERTATEAPVERTATAAPATDVSAAPERGPLAPGSVLGEPNVAEIDEEEVGGVHVVTEVTPPRGDDADDKTEESADTDGGLELDFSTDVRHGEPPVGRAGEVDLAPAAGDRELETGSGIALIVAGGSDDVETATDVQDAARGRGIEAYLAEDVTHDVPPVDEPPELDEKTGLYGARRARQEATQNEAVVSGLEEHATDEAYQEPDVTVPYDPGQPGQAEPLPPISPASLAAHADEEPYVEPDLTRPYGPEVEEVLAQEKRAESPRPRFPSVGPLVPEPLEPPVKEKKPDDAYLSIELKDEPEE